MNPIFRIIAIFALVAVVGLQCSEPNAQQELYSILVPGQNGRGGYFFQNME